MKQGLKQQNLAGPIFSIFSLAGQKFDLVIYGWANFSSL
jgi:hypothetical protein